MCKVTKNIALYDKIPLHKDKKVIKIWEMLTKQVTLQHYLKQFTEFLFTNH